MSVDGGSVTVDGMMVVCRWMGWRQCDGGWGDGIVPVDGMAVVCQWMRRW